MKPFFISVDVDETVEDLTGSGDKSNHSQMLSRISRISKMWSKAENWGITDGRKS